MKNKILVLAVGVMLASCASNKTIKPTVINLDEVNNELVIKATEGDLIKISAKTNPSTGYNWVMKLDDDCSVQFIDFNT